MFEIGLCGWCIDRHDLCRGIEVARRDLGVGVVQIGVFSAESLRRADAEAIARTARDANVSITGTFVGFDGEDYSSIERIAATGGFTPDDAYPGRLAMIREAAALTAALGCRSLAVHAATIPTEPTSPLYARLIERVREAADATAAHGVRLLLETGREPIETLVGFIHAVDRPNVAVNFDAGNLVIYGADEPAKTVAKLGGLIEGVHAKDALRSTRPGVEYGRAAPLGLGDAQIARVVSKLRTIGYDRSLLVETPAASEGLQGMHHALEYLRTLLL